MAISIDPIPEIPQTLLGAAEQRTLVPFIGAGVSMLAGSPDWKGFANRGFDPFIAAGKFSHAELDLLQSYTPRQRLSVATSLEDAATGIDWTAILHPTGKLDHPKGLAIYGYLGALARVWVTTNYDNWPAQILPNPMSKSSDVAATATTPSNRSRFYRPAEFLPENLDVEDAVFHIHGCLLEKSSMIITMRDYLEHYTSQLDENRNEQNQTLEFLKFLFARRNLLFVGYGLGELEILEYLIQKSPDPRRVAGAAPQHYILQGFFSHEEKIVQHLERYYLELGVGLLPFRKDEKGHDQLIDVIAKYAERLQPVGPATTKDIDDMKELLNG